MKPGIDLQCVFESQDSWRVEVPIKAVKTKTTKLPCGLPVTTEVLQPSFGFCFGFHHRQATRLFSYEN